MAQVRMMKATDVKDIHELNKQLGYEYEEHLVYERILSLLEAGNDILLVVEVDNKVIGYAHGSPYETLYADKLMNAVAFVVDDHHPQEFDAGKMLYEEFEHQSKQFGYAGIRLVANQDRKKAEEFFKLHGFISHRDLKHFIKLF